MTLANFPVNKLILSLYRADTGEKYSPLFYKQEKRKSNLSSEILTVLHLAAMES